MIYGAVTMTVKKIDISQPHVTGPGGTRRRVSFSDVPDEVREVVDRYPTNFFYNECDVTRFRREMEKCSSDSVKDTSSLSLLLIAAAVIGLTTVAVAACLPLLMGITLVHVFRSHNDAVDSSIITEVDDSHQHATAALLES